jgi:tartrate dehydratase beta subunit/fumarate hydratase class I family protein
MKRKLIRSLATAAACLLVFSGAQAQVELLAATVGKGVRSQVVKDACVRNGAVYFVTVGGAAAYLAKCVTSSETLAYDDLGTEALRRIQVVDFPVFVGVDVLGNDIYAS